MSSNTEQDFELVEDPERKSSTSESFENVEDKSTESSSENSNLDENEENQTFKVENKKEEEEEAKLPFVDQSIKDEREKPKEKDGEDLVEEYLNAPIRKDQEQFYTAEDSRNAIFWLIFFSAMMFTVPLLVMFTLYYWVFIDHFHLPPDQAMLYSGIAAAIVVILICAAFAYVAWKEESDAENKLKESKKVK